MPEEFFNAVFFNEPAIFQDDTAVADLLNDRHLVSDQNDRNIVLPVDILDQLKDDLSIDELVRRLMNEYEVTEEYALNAVRTYTNQLDRDGILIL